MLDVILELIWARVKGRVAELNKETQSLEKVKELVLEVFDEVDTLHFIKFYILLLDLVGLFLLSKVRSLTTSQNIIGYISDHAGVLHEGCQPCAEN